MNPIVLEASQMLGRHPILDEEDTYKIKYLNVLEYFVRTYSASDIWANETLAFYVKKMLKDAGQYRYKNFNLQTDIRPVLIPRVHPFKIFTYSYCLVIDCIFICAFGDKEKGKEIYTELSSVYPIFYQEKLRRVFEAMYDSSVSTDGISQIEYLKKCWDRNCEFFKEEPVKVIVTANMSAGKSTLLNAFVGKRVNKTQNDACTAKIHKIVNKPYEDGFCYEWDYLLDLDADYETLMDDNSDNPSPKITVGAFFRTIGQRPKRVWLIDTPGVNSSQNTDHKLLTEETIRNTEADLLIYLMNGENIGTDDDRKHLLFIQENYEGKILFVVNKVDRFRRGEDSIEETLKKVVFDLTDLGFENPEVVPVSSYAAYLAKMSIFSESLDEDDQDEYERLSRKMKKAEYQLGRYYSEEVRENINIGRKDQNRLLLLHSGLLHLEKMIYNYNMR